VAFALFVNGFSFTTVDGREATVSLSPFSLVRNVRFQDGEATRLKTFKIFHVDSDPYCYLAARSMCERQAEEDRADWVLGISHTILLITDSIVPRYITCDPLPGVPTTHRRLLASYLVHRDDGGTMSVLFCELHGHEGEESARVVLYENEYCHTPIMDILIHEESACCDCVGINGTCFVLDCHYFASRTSSERKVWLRALSNVKVKLKNHAPPPTEQEIRHHRDAIREQVDMIMATQGPRISTNPLLNRCKRKALQTVGDGDQDPPADLPADDITSGPINTHFML